MATRYSKRYSSLPVYLDGGAANPFRAPEGSVLDPRSSGFSARQWAKAVLRMQLDEPDKQPPREAGVAFANLGVSGFGKEVETQRTVGTVWMGVVEGMRGLLGGGKRDGKRKKKILERFDGLVEPGEMLVVLGPPGSGCSTLLKTISGDTSGLVVDEESYINYQGISFQAMHKHFRGDAIYTAEQDVHFPQLTVGETLLFAAHARAPRNILGGVDRFQWAEHMRDVVMAMFGITHTLNTKVGDEYVRGVSGGERKRVSIAEATLSRAPLQCWDNSTRGLDSANALEFCRTLRVQTEVLGAAACVTIYQASQSAYDVFDKVTVLYEGRQIFFGRCDEARDYFVELGYDCPQRQTTADFLTSMTSPAERIVRPGFENKVPRTPDEFAAVWRSSLQYQRLLADIKRYDEKCAIGGEYMDKFVQSKMIHQAKLARTASPFTLSYDQQVWLCLWRCIRRLKADPSLTVTQLVANLITALILGSVFYNLSDDTSSFFQRGALLFFAILTNAFGSALEILTLYAQRPIVEKHSRLALYHPSAEAFASMLTDIPYKVLNCIVYNLTLYFMTNLRREPGAFFFFLLISFSLTLCMSMLFRTISSVSRTISQAMVPAVLLLLAIVIFTGFTIPTRYMLGWSRWINWIDPVAYGFEALMINEFHGRNFSCSAFVPPYPAVGAVNRICSVVGAEAGANEVNGDAYIGSAYQYYYANKWRDFGIIVAFICFFMATYLLSAEFIRAKKSKGEVLVFRRGQAPKHVAADDVEADALASRVHKKKDGGDAEVPAGVKRQTSIFHWQGLCYDIKTKDGEKRLLDNVDGWVKPGTLTALMGVSGAGKTTLLDTLAARTTVGVVSGEVLVDGLERNPNFQRSTGYVQQQDLHLQTTTVREALCFSALLRQPANVPRNEKLEYAEEVVRLLEMEEYADAIVGVPGEGLNVEQRRRLTIGVELAAKPRLLFLDEPTSGLDSQTSWAICDLIEKLAKNGQSVLCTIHQPSAMLFERFDRLLLLAEGGRTIYFGDMGPNSSSVIGYFEDKGAAACPENANPAEWLLEVIGAAPGSSTDIDWPRTWKESGEIDEVRRELGRLKEKLKPAMTDGEEEYREFSAPFGQQLVEVTKRVFQQYWRTPSYIYSKVAVCLLSALFIGFVFFQATNTIQGLQNQMFAIFMLMTIFSQLIQQLMPQFVAQRSLYEARERPSKAYSWPAFMLANIIVELPWNTLMAIFIFPVYYLIGLQRNALPTHTLNERGGLMFLLIWSMLLFTSTFGHLMIAGVETAEEGSNLVNLCLSLSLIFCGVLASPAAMPHFWMFMYRLSPFTYAISAILSTAVADTDVVCAANELLSFDPYPSNTTCGDYMAAYIKEAGGYLVNPDATSGCRFCTLGDTNAFLATIGAYLSDAWRNFGILWAYIGFNVAGALFLYWAVRVPKKGKGKMA
ncbi:ABC transporter ABCl1 [Saccharata proteae CBS 121410]|uniref:ABC transporter ABCl1 n=1 Tax=Saccharata proteae CBS 121410 TaxID=1314787 RepID=A0A9P4HSC0_9PEZI|nr:ABC transporter ABCl1 [Saccharata proteae CBS 121410]